MSGGRQRVLARIRHALSGVDAAEEPGAVIVDRGYRRAGDLTRDERIEVFAERVGEYRATVHRCTRDDVAPTVQRVCGDHDAQRIVVPDDLPHDWRPDGVEVITDGGRLSVADLDRLDGVLTGCAVAVATTGTIVLDAGPAQGRRALTLVPDLHLCVVLADQVVALVPEAVAALDDAVRAGQPLTMISGPSATSDIELSRVEGVHGPRRLEVLLVVQ